MRYRLRDNLFYCVSGRRTVFLDLNADRYFCLSVAAEAAFQKMIAGPDAFADDLDLRALIARGFLVPDPANPPVSPSACIQIPTCALPSAIVRMHNVRIWIQALVARLSFAHSVGRRQLVEIKQDFLRRGRSAAQFDAKWEAEGLQMIASAFERIDKIISPMDQCLARSLAFLSVCQRNGIFPTLVIGVRTNPFTAHCWVQRNDEVLTGDLEQARLFTPILTIE